MCIGSEAARNDPLVVPKETPLFAFAFEPFWGYPQCPGRESVMLKTR